MVKSEGTGLSSRSYFTFTTFTARFWKCLVIGTTVCLQRAAWNLNPSSFWRNRESNENYDGCAATGERNKIRQAGHGKGFQRVHVPTLKPKPFEEEEELMVIESTESKVACTRRPSRVIEICCFAPQPVPVKPTWPCSQ